MTNETQTINQQNENRRVRSHALAITDEGWLELLWPGKFDYPDGPEEIIHGDIADVLARFHALRAAEGDSFGGIPVWLGHPEDKGESDASPARAWIMDMRINSVTGRLEGRPEWVGDTYEKLVKSKAYRWISNREAGRVTADGVWHPVEILSIGLTNRPARKKGQHVLSHAEPENKHPEMETETMGKETQTGLGLLTRSHGLTGDALSRVELIIGDTPDAEAAANRLLAALGAAETRGHSLAAELETVIVDTLVARGDIADAETGAAHVRDLVQADPAAARAHFLPDGAAARPHADTDTPLGKGLTPENGLRLTGADVVDQAAVEAVRAHTATLVKRGMDYTRAHTAAVELHQAGKLPATSQ